MTFFLSSLELWTTLSWLLVESLKILIRGLFSCSSILLIVFNNEIFYFVWVLFLRMRPKYIWLFSNLSVDKERWVSVWILRSEINVFSVLSFFSCLLSTELAYRSLCKINFSFSAEAFTFYNRNYRTAFLKVSSSPSRFLFD